MGWVGGGGGRVVVVVVLELLEVVLELLEVVLELLEVVLELLEREVLFALDPVCPCTPCWDPGLAAEAQPPATRAIDSTATPRPRRRRSQCRARSWPVPSGTRTQAA